MKIRNLTEKAVFALLLLPAIIAATVSKKATPPVLPSLVYYLPEDLKIESKEMFAGRLYESTGLKDLGLEKKVLDLALEGFSKLAGSGKLNNDSLITIVDFSQSSKEKRFYVIDLKNVTLRFNTRVAHGKNSGAEYARYFSNVSSSNKSSLGFYITQNAYIGSNGYSLRLRGIEKNINDKALSRNIVVHGAAYANDNYLRSYGMLGRSFGCPALPTEDNKAVIDVIKNGSCFFIYNSDEKYFKQSTVLNG